MGPPSVEVRAAAERIGSPGSQLRVADAQGKMLHNRAKPLPHHATALDALFAWLRSRQLDEGLLAIGQRVVHGGSRYSAPTLITDTVLAVLRALVPLDTEHLPHAIRAIERVQHAFPALPQVACFDTAFHRFHLAAEAIRRAPRLRDRAPELIAACDARIAESTAHAREYLEGQPEIRDWAWTS